jgi:hypothetical protein
MGRAGERERISTDNAFLDRIFRSDDPKNLQCIKGLKASDIFEQNLENRVE